MSKTKIFRNGKELGYDSFVFPGGEVGVKLLVKNSVAFAAKTGFFAPATYQTIVARIQNSQDFMELAMLKDALAKVDNTPVHLFLPYLPYARQDRVCNKGEAFSLDVFIKLIAGLNFQKVTICDPHSDVTAGIFSALNINSQVITQFDIINKYLDFAKRIAGCALVSPDAGSNKKTSEIAAYFAHTNFIRADKLRDLSNGQIKETVVYADNLNGQDVCILDDICDGGRTFIELAKALKAKNAGKIILYVTHGIFSKGVKVLFENGIDEIWTTNSYKWFADNFAPHYEDKVKVLSLEDKFLTL